MIMECNALKYLLIVIILDQPINPTGVENPALIRPFAEKATCKAAAHDAYKILKEDNKAGIVLCLDTDPGTPT